MINGTNTKLKTSQKTALPSGTSNCRQPGILVVARQSSRITRAGVAAIGKNVCKMPSTVCCRVSLLDWRLGPNESSRHSIPLQAHFDTVFLGFPMKIAFLSYAHANDKHRDSKILSLIAKVEGEIRERLGSDAFSIFVDRKDIRYAQEWQRCIDSGLTEAAVLIPVISPHYLNSPACQQEYKQFAAKEQEFLTGYQGVREDRLILPLRLLPASTDQQENPIWLDVSKRTPEP